MIDLMVTIRLVIYFLITMMLWWRNVSVVYTSVTFVDYRLMPLRKDSLMVDKGCSDRTVL